MIACFLAALSLLVLPAQRVRVGDSVGSGVSVACVNGQTLILTANHVVKDGGQCTVDNIPGKVIAQDGTWDLAAIVVSTTKFPIFSLGSHKPKIGESLTLCGFGSSDYKSSIGQVNGFCSPKTEENGWITISTSGRSGDSGGPMFFSDGSVGAILFGSIGGSAYGTHCLQIRSFLKTIQGYNTLIDQALKNGRSYVFTKDRN
jgi:S1-C subfamily serine protease